MAEFVNSIDVVGDDALVDSIISRTITEFKDNTLITIGGNAFASCANLITVDIPAVTVIESEGFRDCLKLETVNIPSVTTINGAFYYSKKLTTVDAPKLVSMKGWSSFGYGVLQTLILRSTSMCTSESADTLIGTPIARGTGYIYVPSALINSYKVATNWSVYASQFRALENYTVDGTTTGELDPNKI